MKLSYKKKLNQVKTLLSMEVKLESEILKDGTSVEAEVFEIGYPLYVEVEGELTPAPEGTYETESGKTITVDAEGNISAIEETVTEEVVEEVTEEVKAETEEVKAETEEVETETKEVETDLVQEALKEIVLSLETLTNEILTIKEELASLKTKQEEFAAQPAAEKFPIITKENTSFNHEDKLEARLAGLKHIRENGTI